MSKQTVELATQQIVAGTIRNTINQFLLDREARPCSKRTIEFYSVELMYFTRFLTTMQLA